MKIRHKRICWKIKENTVQKLSVLVLDCCGDKWKSYFLVHEERSLSSILCQILKSTCQKRFPLFLFSQVNEIEHHTSNTFDVYMSKSFLQIQWRHIWMLRHSTFYAIIKHCFDKDMIWLSLSVYFLYTIEISGFYFDLEHDGILIVYTKVFLKFDIRLLNLCLVNGLL